MSTKGKTGTALSKALQSAHETGASTDQGDPTVNHGSSPPPLHATLQSFPSPDMNSKKQRLRDHRVDAGRLTITTGAKKRPTGADGRMDLLAGTSEFQGSGVNRVSIVNPQTSEAFGATFERSGSPLNAGHDTMATQVQNRIQTSVPGRKRGSLEQGSDKANGHRPTAINCKLLQAQTPVQHHLPWNPLSPQLPKTANDFQSSKGAAMYNNPSSKLHQITNSTSPARQNAYVVRSKDDYSGQLMALGKGADTVLIKDMIKRSNNEIPAESSRADATPRTPISTNRKNRSNLTSYQRRRKYISQVPPTRPEPSPPIGYSKAVRCSSNFAEFDPETIVGALQKNRFFHKNFNHTMTTKQWRNQFREIIDHVVPKDDPDYVDVYTEFASKQISVIDKIKAAEERKQKEIEKQLKANMSDEAEPIGVMKRLDQMLGNVSE